MTAFGLAESVRLTRAAMAGGREVALAVVVAGPPELLGRRLAWDGERLHGSLGDPAADGAARSALAGAGESPATVRVGDSGLDLYVERIVPPFELVIVGAGHIAVPLASIGSLLGWRVTVLDDRPEFARAERFPDADRVIVADFADPFAGIPIGPRTRLVLVTRGHRYDYDCLRALAAMGAEPAYVGMIGSRRRVRAAFEMLAGEGFAAEWLARVRAPIGLDVEAQTPAEIAVAVAAEMIQAERGGTGRPLRDVEDVVRYVKALRPAED
ncbi:MAG TPA: XdhC family protein [Gemmatimonadota bacterium]|nr:XdhC family protein [Gemmatimonadota bacterium]